MDTKKNVLGPFRKIAFVDFVPFVDFVFWRGE